MWLKVTNLSRELVVTLRSELGTVETDCEKIQYMQEERWENIKYARNTLMCLQTLSVTAGCHHFWPILTYCDTWLFGEQQLPVRGDNLNWYVYVWRLYISG